MKIIAASLTRTQANAVRKRIDSLNEAIRLRKLNKDNPLPSEIHSKRKDVRNFFMNDLKTKGESTSAENVVKVPGERQLMPTQDIRSHDIQTRYK